MTDVTPAYDPNPAMNFLGGMCDTALDTMKPGIRADVLKLCQGHVNALVAELTKGAALAKTCDELRAQVAALEVVANAPKALISAEPDHG